MILADMKLILGLAITSFGLLGCEQAPPKLSAEARAVEEAFADEISLRADLIMPGMTREEVVNILGPVHRTIGGPLKPDYTCSEFRYVKEVGSWYVLVWFENDIVDDVIGAIRDECYLAIV